jgi:endo-1,4-beta-xylanase
MTVSGSGTITVPLTFQASHDAFAVYVTPGPGTTTPTPTPTSHESSPPVTAGCTASVSNNAWTGGFVTTVRVTAGSSPVNAWSVAITLPGGSAVTNSWNTQASGSTGTVRFSNVSYNGQLAPAGSTEFGFQGTGAPPTTATCTAS